MLGIIEFIVSGIAGFLTHKAHANAAAYLSNMLAHLQHRGPHNVGQWHNGPVGLGQCALWATPEAPAADGIIRKGTMAIIADTRLDNRATLGQLLDLDERTVSDSELILAAYQRWGTDCPTHLLGDFAFTIWDSTQQRLFCARDHFGVKPFCYYAQHDHFIFASEAKALLAHPNIATQLNEPRIADYLVMQLEGVDLASTFFANIHQLPPAHSLSATSAGVTLERYWQLEPPQPLHFGSLEAYDEAFLALFTEAVRCRLRAHSGAGSMLSGGLDSSSIVGVARHLYLNQNNGRLPTFSAVSPPTTRCGETTYINQMIQLGQLNSYQLLPGQIAELDKEIDYLFDHTDNLFDTIMLLPQLMYIAAQKQGLHVLLDGVDGDLVTSQHEGLLVHLLRQGAWQTAVSQARAISQFYQNCYAPLSSPTRLLLRSGSYAFAPALLRQRWQQWKQQQQYVQAVSESIISPSFARRIQLPQRLAQLDQQLNTTHISTLAAFNAHRVRTPYITAALERYDRVAAAYSIEPRHPFLDKRLVEFCLAIPWQAKMHNGYSKAILRRAMANVLPDAVRWRKGCWERLNVTLTMQLVKHQRPFIEEVIAYDLDKIGAYVDKTAVLRAYNHYKTTEDASAGYQLWQAVSLVRWLRRYQFIR